MREKWKSEKHSTSRQNKERRKTVRVKLVIQYREEQWMGFHANCQLVTTIKQTDGYLSYQLSSAFFAHAQSGIKQIQLENYCNIIYFDKFEDR